MAGGVAGAAQSRADLYSYKYVCVYIYIYVCVCVCVCLYIIAKCMENGKTLSSCVCGLGMRDRIL